MIDARIYEASCSTLSEYCWPFNSQTSILILMCSTEALKNLAPKALSPRLLYQSWLDILASHHTIVAFNSDLAIDRAYTRSRVPTPLRWNWGSHANLRNRTIRWPFLLLDEVWSLLSMGNDSVKSDITAIGLSRKGQNAPRCIPLSSSGNITCSTAMLGQRTEWRRGIVCSCLMICKRRIIATNSDQSAI